MVKPFDSHFKTTDEDDKRAAVKHAVELGLQGDIAALTYLFRNSGEGGLTRKQPLVTFTIGDGSPCPTCGALPPTNPFNRDD